MFDGLVEFPMITITLHNQSPPHHSPTSLTVTLDLYVGDYYPLLKSKDCDWAAFFSNILKLEEHIGTVQIGFSGLEDYETFYSKVFPTSAKEVLSHLNGVGKLTEGCWNVGPKLWTSVSSGLPLGEGQTHALPVAGQVTDASHFDLVRIHASLLREVGGGG